jgi:hypothetical protein
MNKIENMENFEQAESHYQMQQAKKKTKSIETMLSKIAGGSLIVAISALAFATVTQFQLTDANDKLANNKEIIYVRLSETGTHEVTFDNTGESDRFFKPVIEASLANYIDYRFREHSDTIRNDYGFALMFLGNKERRKFTTEYDAAEVAREQAECPSCDQVDVSLRAIRHEVWTQANSSIDGTIYKSVIYFKKIFRDKGSSVAKSEENYILRLDWRFRPREELLASPNTLQMMKANPLGIQILDQSENRDFS